MSDVFFGDLGLRLPDHHRGADSGSHVAQTEAVMTAFEPLVDRLAPEAVVVAPRSPCTQWRAMAI